MMLLRHAAMYEDIIWTAIRHTNDFHAQVTEDEVKADAFATAMSHAVSAAAECLGHSFYRLRGTEDRGSQLSIGEALGQQYAAYQVIRAAYEALREHGILEKHSEIWDRIDADPEVKRHNDYLQKLADDRFLWRVVADNRAKVDEGAR